MRPGLRTLPGAALAAALAACAGPAPRTGTLAELHEVEADLEEVMLADGLERAAESYRRYLEETPEGALTPEAMRRLADLQIEQAYGVIGHGEPASPIEMAAPADHTPAELEAPEIARIAPNAGRPEAAAVPRVSESDAAFEERALAREALIAPHAGGDPATLPGAAHADAPAGPREAIETYRKILANYPNYERNDQVLYQMSRAYDEIGQPDEAMAVMDRLVSEYPHSRYIDEVHFRRGEYYFVRKDFRDAESAYGAVIAMGPTSSFYELALYKLGWSLYKQDFYEEALHRYMAMLDYRLSIGYDFERNPEEDDEHRIADTFRVISLSFSNLGGPEVIDEYFSAHGHRPYADKIYGNLGEFYFAKLRYEDAASVYRSFVDLNPWHDVAPHFGMRTIEIYAEAGFPQRVVESKKTFATRYALDAEYWQHHDPAAKPEVVGLVKSNLTDLANHYHALYQEEALADERPANFAEASHWYREFLASFPQAPESPGINYQLAGLLLENENFGEAALAYEATAYGYGPHEQAAGAGYAAVYAWRAALDAATGAQVLAVKTSTVESSLRFVDIFPAHDQAAVVLGAATDDLYDMQDYARAIERGRLLVARYPESPAELRRSAWAVIGHSSIDTAAYVDAEIAYTRVLELTTEDDETRPAIVDGLAASIYKQAEQANLLQDYRAAASHFLRIKTVAPTSSIRSAAEYDAAAALMKLEDWTAASGVLEDFRAEHPEHELNQEATKQLAYVYRQDGQIERSAAEHERIAADASDPELAREALLTAGELYDEAGATADAIRVYETYAADYPVPLDVALETRSRLAEIFKSQLDYDRYYDQLDAIVAADAEAGAGRSDRSRYLAAHAGLVLAERSFDEFERLNLVQPFEQSLAEKQARMDEALRRFQDLVAYEVRDVTAAATYYIAETYMAFSDALLASERPPGLNASEQADYEMVIEEEAYPFEEQSIEVHERNVEFLSVGIYNAWVQKSLDRLALVMPGRYAKNEISGGFLGSIDTYAYRMPIAPPPEPGDSAEPAQSGETRDSVAEAAAQMSAAE